MNQLYMRGWTSRQRDLIRTKLRMQNNITQNRDVASCHATLLIKNSFLLEKRPGVRPSLMAFVTIMQTLCKSNHGTGTALDTLRNGGHNSVT